MANIKISELNELTKSQRAYDDYLAIVDSSANETKKISLENIMQNNIQLLAVTDTAPSECNIGDKYYNTKTGLIYTAIEEDTWGTTGETPITDILYIVLEERTSYTYDGTDLVSVGGGAGSSVVVEPEEATEDTKLIIEEEDLDFTGLEISNEYNNANNMAYSCDYVNKAFGGTILWTNPNPTDDFSNQTITLNSSDYDAYELIYARSKSQNIRYSTGRIPKGSSFNIFVFAGEESGGYLSYRYRNLNYVSDTSLSVSNCIQKIVNETTTGTANATCIPLYIIGYKTGLFR